MADNKETGKALTKSETFQHLATATGLTRKQVTAVFEELNKLIKKELRKKEPGVFTIPGLLKARRVDKPATKGGTKPNPFKPGEMMTVKPRKARKVVKLRPLKGLNEMVS
jgi:nucleoid DNA-binding protein